MLITIKPTFGKSLFKEHSEKNNFYGKPQNFVESVIQAFFIIAKMSNRNKAKLIVISGIIIILFALVLMIRNLFSGKTAMEPEGEIVEATVSAKPKEYLYEFDL